MAYVIAGLIANLSARYLRAVDFGFDSRRAGRQASVAELVKAVV
jgi:hypothetical protein